MDSIEGPKTAFDFAGLGALKASAAKDGGDPEAAKKAAQQFESMFLQMMLKSMRDAVPKGGLFESKATKTFEQMFDQQVVLALAERRSTGLSQMIEKFITQSHTSLELGESSPEKFSLENKEATYLPVIKESEGFSIPEGSVKTFLLNREFKFLKGGD